MAMMAAGGIGNPLDAIEDVDIDGSGVFKYVLMEITVLAGFMRFQKHIVRGHSGPGTTVDLADPIQKKLSQEMGISSEVLGGGFIDHQPNKRKISVYGTSEAFGRPDHSITAELLKKKYPNYTDISWSNEGQATSNHMMHFLDKLSK